MLNNLRASRLPQLLCAFPQAQYFSLGFLAKFFVPFLSQYCLFALVFFSSQIAEVVTEPIPRASDSREGEEGLSNLLTLLHRPQSTLHRCSRPQPPRSDNSAKERKGKRKWERREQRKPRRTCSRPLWATGVISLRFSCVIRVQRRSSVSYSHCKVSLASLFLCFTSCSLFCYSFFSLFFLGCSDASPFRPLLCPWSVALSHHFRYLCCLPLLIRCSLNSLLFCRWLLSLSRLAFPSSSFLSFLISTFCLFLLEFQFWSWGSIRPVLELGAQVVRFWSLGLNSTCKVFFQPFFLSCFFLNFFFIFYLLVVFKNVISCLSPKQKKSCFILFFKIHVFWFILFIYLFF